MIKRKLNQAGHSKGISLFWSSS